MLKGISGVKIEASKKSNGDTKITSTDTNVMNAVTMFTWVEIISTIKD